MSFLRATWEPGNIAQIHELRVRLSVSNWDKARAFFLPDRSLRVWLVTLLILAFGAFLLFMDMVNGGPHPYYTAIRLAATDRAQTIRDALEHYAKDHNGRFPSGRNSTEICQQLLDEHYVAPGVFYVYGFPGKVEADWDQRLKPENICWDVTSGLVENSPDALPVVFSTGFKIAYASDSTAVPHIMPYPRLFLTSRTVEDWWNGEPDPTPYAALVVCRMAGYASFIRLDKSLSPIGTIPHFISANVKLDGKTYRQLTPDGVLQ
jgi:hypothetical protein